MSAVFAHHTNQTVNYSSPIDVSSMITLSTLVVGMPPWSRRRPNQRLQLTARGGRLIGKESLLIAAAAGRSLSAIR